VSGGKARFWEDVWLQDSNLKSLYPRLYTLSLDQGKTVRELGGWEEDRWRWRLSWRRDKFEWEGNMENELISSLSLGRLYQDAQDYLFWKEDSKGMFSVKSAYSLLAQHQTHEVMDNVFGLLWQSKATPKTLVTAWRILLDRLPTNDNLIRRGIQVNSPLCALCGLSDESSQHVFLECAQGQRVWSRCYRWIGILGANNKDIRSHFVNFSLVHLSSTQNQVWRGLWAAIVRSIWEPRNQVVFRGGIPDADEVFQNAQLWSWLWLKHKTTGFTYAFSDWLLNPNHCLSAVI